MNRIHKVSTRRLCLGLAAGAAVVSMAFSGTAAFAVDGSSEDVAPAPVEAVSSGNSVVELVPGEYRDDASNIAELESLGFTTLDTPVELTEGGVSAKAGPPTCVGCYARSWETQSTGSKVAQGQVFVRYLTSAWAKSSSYTWSKETSVSATLSASIGPGAGSVAGSLGLSVTRTQSWGVSVTIPTDPKKFSKLTLRSDYWKTPVRSRSVDKAFLKPTIYGSWKAATLMSPTNNQYLTVTYQ